MRASHAIPLAAMFLTACLSGGGKDKPNADPEDKPIAPPDKIPEMVDIPAGDVVVGFARGRIRNTVSLDAFKIMKHPVTNAQYEECVEAGACEAVECVGEAESLAATRLGVNAYRWDTKNAPATCVVPSAAEAYCEWLGGGLLTPAQWMLSSRGKDPASYPWGGEEAGCERHPLVRVDPEVSSTRDALALMGTVGERPSSAHSPDASCHPQNGDQPIAVEVGQYPDGAAPSGAEDWLLPGAELARRTLRGTRGLIACRDESGHCSIYGSSPGRIDAMHAIAASDAATTRASWAFRCVISANDEDEVRR